MKIGWYIGWPYKKKVRGITSGHLRLGLFVAQSISSLVVFGHLWTFLLEKYVQHMYAFICRGGDSLYHGTITKLLIYLNPILS